MTKVVFFGNEKLATGIPPAAPLIRSAVERAGFNIEQIVTEKLSTLRPHSAKMAVLAAYGHIIPQSVLDRFPLGIINVHPSLLPAYRGPTPIETAILDDATKTGVSIMRLTAGMDEGPIYTQKSIVLNGNESKAVLTQKLQTLGAELIGSTLSSIADGSLKPRSQPHPDRATYSRKLTKQDGVLDWNKPATLLEREVRAFLGWPGSRTTLAGKDVVVTKATVDETVSGEPGTVFKTNNKKIGVYTRQGALIIEQLKPAGKTEMTSSAFLAGYGNKL